MFACLVVSHNGQPLLLKLGGDLAKRDSNFGVLLRESSLDAGLRSIIIAHLSERHLEHRSQGNLPVCQRYGALHHDLAACIKGWGGYKA